MVALLLLAGSLAITSCTKEEGKRFRLVVDGLEKTFWGTNHITFWSQGDALYVNGDNFVTVSETGSDTYAQSDVVIAPINNKFYAFYGGRATNINTRMVLPASQKFGYSMSDNYTYDASALNSPMAGVGEEGSNVTILFSNLFSLLELSVPIANSTNSYSITITEIDPTNNMPLAGDFESEYTANGWSTSCIANASYTLTVQKSTSETKVYIPIPAGGHKLDIQINALCHAAQNSNYTFKSGHYYAISTLPNTPESAPLLPYPFGDDDNSYFFGKGNMSYVAARNPQWRLEPNQWDTTMYVPGTNDCLQSSQLSWMIQGLLNPANLNNGGSVTGLLYPQGYASLLGVDNAELDNWKVLTRAQWRLILGLDGSNPRWAYVKISYTKNGNNLDQNGLLIVPSGASGGSGYTLGQTYSNDWTDVPTITSSYFEGTLEPQGCIFLPAYGYVNHTGGAGTWTNNGNGYYRTADPVNANGTGSRTYVLYFTPTATPNTTQTIQYGAGASVRLVYVASNAPANNN